MSNLQGQFWTPRPLHRAWGRRTIFPVAQPAVGTGFSFELEHQFYWKLNGVVFKLVTSAQAAERKLALAFKNGNGLVYATSLFTSANSASATAVVYFGISNFVLPGGSVARMAVPLPDVLQDLASKVELVTAGLQTEDQISEIVVDAEAFEPDPRHDFAEIEAMARRIQDLERKVAAHALPVHA